MDGYMGKILRVNLTDQSWKEEPLNPKLAATTSGERVGLPNHL